nr:PREDICTED: coiled-coil domain-containing protein 81-like [Struthio camelus australis]
MAFPGPDICPTLRKLTRDDVTKIWAAVSHYIRLQLLLNKAVKITGIGTFFIVKEQYPSGCKAPFILRRPVFMPSEAFVELRGLKPANEEILGDREIAQLNYPRIALEAAFSPDTVQGCVDETVFLFACYLLDGKNVDFVLKDVGILVVRGKDVRMRYCDQFLLTVDWSGNLMKALCSNPQTEDLVVTSREAAVYKMHPGCVLVFPAIARDLAENIPVPLPEAPIQEKKGEKTEGRDAEIKKELQREAHKEEPKKEGSAPASRPLSRDQLSLPKIAGAEAKEDKGQRVKRKKKSLSRLPAIQGSSMQGESGKQAVTTRARVLYVCPKCGSIEEEQQIAGAEAKEDKGQRVKRKKKSLSRLPAIQGSSMQGESGKQAVTTRARVLYVCPKCGSIEEEQQKSSTPRKMEQQEKAGGNHPTEDNEVPARRSISPRTLQTLRAGVTRLVEKVKRTQTGRTCADSDGEGEPSHGCTMLISHLYEEYW